MKKTNFILFAIFFAALVVWIGVFLWDYIESQEEVPWPPSAADYGAKIANPAAVFCEKQGGKIQMYEDEMGQSGYCVFEDGRICEEWALFRKGKCNSPE